MKNVKINAMFQITGVFIILTMLFTLTACERNVKNKKMTVQSSIGELKGKYTGRIVNGEPVGDGTLCVFDDEGDLFRKFQLKDKEVLSGEFYYQKLKHREYFYEDGEVKNGRWFGQKGNIIWESELTDRGYPELFQKKGNPYFSIVSNTREFTKSNLWKFYGGICSILYSYEGENGAICYDASLRTLFNNASSGSVTFVYFPKDDEPRIEADDKVMWKGQLIDVDGTRPVIEAYEFNLLY